ncbi:MAG: hypothetical protein ACKO5X_08620 [Limnohabitans sp.]
MWKLVVGFLVFAALTLFVIFKAGDQVDMGGEKHGVEAVHVPEDTKPAAAPVSATDTPTAPVTPAAPAAAPAPAGK